MKGPSRPDGRDAQIGDGVRRPDGDTGGGLCGDEVDGDGGRSARVPRQRRRLERVVAAVRRQHVTAGGFDAVARHASGKSQPQPETFCRLVFLAVVQATQFQLRAIHSFVDQSINHSYYNCLITTAAFNNHSLMKLSFYDKNIRQPPFSVVNT